MRLANVAARSFDPTPEEKRRALCEVRYEIEHVLTLLTRIHSTPAADLVLRRALRDRMVVHLRTILGFLEMSRRTAHYRGGFRQENDDVLAMDYGFPPQKLPIPDDERRELRRSRPALSYSDADHDSHRSPGALLTLTLPVLRRCTAFARYLLSESRPEIDETEAAAWARLGQTLEIFATTGAGTSRLLPG